MVIVKIKKGTDGDVKYLYNLLKYLKNGKNVGIMYDNNHNVVVNEDGIVELKVRNDFVYMHGYGCSYWDWHKCYEEMMIVKKYFHKLNKNPVMHYEIGFDDKHPLKMICIYGTCIESYFKQLGFQLVWVIHRNLKYENTNKRYHIHCIVNPVNLKNGKLLNHYFSKRGYMDFVHEIGVMTGDFVLPYVVCNVDGDEKSIFIHYN